MKRCAYNNINHKRSWSELYIKGLICWDNKGVYIGMLPSNQIKLNSDVHYQKLMKLEETILEKGPV